MITQTENQLAYTK